MVKICRNCGMLLDNVYEIKEQYKCPCCNNMFENSSKELLDNNSYLEVKEEDFNLYLNKLLSSSIRLASQYHRFQVDKAGAPYILHPLAVMNIIKEEDYYFNLICKIVAVLHDIIEDTPVTYEGLIYSGFPVYIATAVDLLSKKEGQSKNQYFKILKKNPIARIVKLADLTHNMDISRIKNPTEKDFKRASIYKERYNELIKN